MHGQNTRSLRRCQINSGMSGFPYEKLQEDTGTQGNVHTHTHTHTNLSINSEMLAIKVDVKKTQQAECSKTLFT
jgi:hypothetical protein